MAKIGILQVKEVVDALLDYVKTDYEARLDEDPTGKTVIDQSYIYRILDADDVAEGISYRDLAVEIFSRGKKEKRKIETRLMFDVERASLPTIHFREPSKTKGRQDAIGGMGIGYFSDSSYVDDVLIEDGYTLVRQRSFESNYELMITSINRHEVLIIDEILTGLLVGAQDTLAQLFQTFEFSNKELMANNGLVPQPLFIKSITIKVGVNKTYPDLSSNEYINSLLFSKILL